MPTGQSLNVGLNELDPQSYGGWPGVLTACEADAEDMQALAEAAGFGTKKLLTKAGTRDAVLGEIRAASKGLQAGDIFLLTYSGHGGQVPAQNNDEDNNLDETWCLFDGELVDDEPFALWSGFSANVRIVVLADSCHSGSAIRFAPGFEVPAALKGSVHAASAVPRGMPLDAVGRAYRAKKDLHDKIQQEKAETEDDIHASVLLISGCQDPHPAQAPRHAAAELMTLGNGKRFATPARRLRDGGACGSSS